MTVADITPTTAIVGAWKNQLQWPTIISELIDNAFDAGAQQIRITVERDSLIIADDGVGCPDLGRMLTAGHHEDHKTTRLGRYGIGFKQAVASAGDVLEVVSVHQGYMQQVSLSWDLLEKSGTWTIPLPPQQSTSEASGTVVTISRLRNKNGLTRASIATLITRLSEQYTPAIKHGRQIVLQAYKRQTALQALQPPELEHARNLELLIGRKKAYLHLGLVPDGVSYPYSGLAVSYSFRVIQRSVRWGLGDEPTPGLVLFQVLILGLALH